MSSPQKCIKCNSLMFKMLKTKWCQLIENIQIHLAIHSPPTETLHHIPKPLQAQAIQSLNFTFGQFRKEPRNCFHYNLSQGKHKNRMLNQFSYSYTQAIDIQDIIILMKKQYYGMTERESRSSALVVSSGITNGIQHPAPHQIFLTELYALVMHKQYTNFKQKTHKPLSQYFLASVLSLLQSISITYAACFRAQTRTKRIYFLKSQAIFFLFGRGNTPGNDQVQQAFFKAQ